MILTVTPESRPAHTALIDQYLKIRKQVFHDRLGWDVVVTDERERDLYDRLPCYYLLALAPDGTVQGGLRQMPMTGPTLTWQRFSDMIDDPAALFADDVWETTRFAVRPEDRDSRITSGVNRLALDLCSAALQFGLSRGARRHVAVCEERIVDLTRIFGVRCETIGRKTMPAGEDVICVAWEVSDEFVRRLARISNHLQAA